MAKMHESAGKGVRRRDESLELVKVLFVNDSGGKG